MDKKSGSLLFRKAMLEVIADLHEKGLGFSAADMKSLAIYRIANSEDLIRCAKELPKGRGDWQTKNKSKEIVEHKPSAHPLDAIYFPRKVQRTRRAGV